MEFSMEFSLVDRPRLLLTMACQGSWSILQNTEYRGLAVKMLNYFLVDYENKNNADLKKMIRSLINITCAINEEEVTYKLDLETATDIKTEDVDVLCKHLQSCTLLKTQTVLTKKNTQAKGFKRYNKMSSFLKHKAEKSF